MMDGLTERVQFMAREHDVYLLDKWMFDNNIRGRSAAIRALIAIECRPDKWMWLSSRKKMDKKNGDKELISGIKSCIDKFETIFVAFDVINSVYDFVEDEPLHYGDLALNAAKKIQKILDCGMVRYGFKPVDMGSGKFSTLYEGVIFFGYEDSIKKTPSQ